MWDELWKIVLGVVASVGGVGVVIVAAVKFSVDIIAKRLEEKYTLKMNKELEKYRDDGKNPNPIAKGMSWMKTNMKLSMEESDATIAELMTDGCNMGVKSLNRYLNQYKAADEISKDMAKRLINLEEKLAVDIRQYL